MFEVFKKVPKLTKVRLAKNAIQDDIGTYKEFIR